MIKTIISRARLRNLTSGARRYKNFSSFDRVVPESLWHSGPNRSRRVRRCVRKYLTHSACHYGSTSFNSTLKTNSRGSICCRDVKTKCSRNYRSISNGNRNGGY